MEKLSRQSSIDSVLLLLVVSLMQICNEKEEVGQKDGQNIQFEEEESIRKFNIGAKACTERDKEVKVRLDPHWDKRSGHLRTRSLPPTPQGFQFVETEQKATTKEICCKCDSRMPGSTPSWQSNLV